LDGVIEKKNIVNLGKFKIPMETYQATGKVVLAVRPEDIAISTTSIPGTVEFSAYSVLPSGADSTIIAHMGDTELTVRESGISKIKMDEKIWLKFNPEMINLYDKESGNLIVSKK
jgi:multiple sugar transport system ATP-binding protein